MEMFRRRKAVTIRKFKTMGESSGDYTSKYSRPLSTSPCACL
jgi:hypothetical protein